MDNKVEPLRFNEMICPNQECKKVLCYGNMATLPGFIEITCPFCETVFYTYMSTSQEYRSIFKSDMERLFEIDKNNKVLQPKITFTDDDIYEVKGPRRRKSGGELREELRQYNERHKSGL